MDIDEQIVPWVLRLHAMAGTVALVIAPLAMMVQKGGDWHRRWGKIYFAAMIVVALSAVFLAVVHPKSFWLALVAVFSFHMVASGYRSLYLKKLHEGLRPRGVDLWLHGIAGLMNGGLLIWGISHLVMGVRDTQTLLFLVFGAIGSGMVFANFNRFYKRKHDKREWLFGHMSGFLGGYIATWSAFSAVNFGRWFPMMPSWLVWLWPTIVGVPIIFLWTAHYRKRFANGERVRNIAEVRIR